jgi:hypothetical protein
VTITSDRVEDDGLCEDIFFAFSRAGRAILQMTMAKASLEDIFIELTDSGEKEQLQTVPEQKKTIVQEDAD